MELALFAYFIVGYTVYIIMIIDEFRFKSSTSRRIAFVAAAFVASALWPAFFTYRLIRR